MRVTVPASSANIGPGFDCLAVALDLPFHLDVGEPQGEATKLDDNHPATKSFMDGGGEGPLFAETLIPPGKGLGFSGAARVAGLAAASLQRSGSIHFADLLMRSGELEGHSDNVAASIYGSVTATNENSIVRLKCPSQLDVVVWIPDGKTATDSSRNQLPASVSFEVATQALGRSSVLVAAIASGDLAAMRQCCVDDLHQPTRLAASPQSAQALKVALENGASAAWLSGSGPTIAAFVDSGDAEQLRQVLPGSGHSKILKVAPHGIYVS
jgi:homoserine kinase